MRTLEIVALIYRSVRYLDFCVDQLQQHGKLNEQGDPAAGKQSKQSCSVSFRIIANDATPEVLRRLTELRDTQGVRFDVFNAPNPSEFYINRVYRAWNFAVLSSTADIVCPVNSDMAFSPGWLDALLRHHDEVNIPCSRLVENGRQFGERAAVFRESRHVVFGDFGRGPQDFHEADWLSFAARLREPDLGRIEPYGFYSPYLIDRERFAAAGGYPHGNIHKHGIGRLVTRRGRASPLLECGDAWFFRKVLGDQFGMRHITAFDSLVYHFKEGEMRESESREGESESKPNSESNAT